MSHFTRFTAGSGVFIKMIFGLRLTTSRGKLTMDFDAVGSVAEKLKERSGEKLVGVLVYYRAGGTRCASTLVTNRNLLD